MIVHPAIVETLLNDLKQSEPELSREQRRRLKCRVPAEKRIMRWRPKQQNGDTDDA